MTELLSLSAIQQHSEQLLEPVEFSVPKAVAYTNLADHNPTFAAHLCRDVYVERRCALFEVSLVALPAGATIVGGGHFILRIGQALVKEQYPVYLQNPDSHISGLISNDLPVEDVGQETVVLARYGIFTWGHWLGELLPKAVLAESQYPGRFSFVVPYEVIADTSPNLPWIKIRQSLDAYGINEHRLIPVARDRNYSFKRLFAVTPVWSDHLIHPGAISLMRAAIQAKLESKSYSRTAIDRIVSYGRGIQNHEEIRNILRNSGFEIKTTGALSFLDQVTLFSRTNCLFGVLGSDLTNLIYSPEGVKVITAAPAIFGDRFFYGLILSRNGLQFDLRGPITSVDEKIPHRSTFSIDPTELMKAIALCNDVGHSRR